MYGVFIIRSARVCDACGVLKVWNSFGIGMCVKLMLTFK